MSDVASLRVQCTMSDVAVFSSEAWADNGDSFMSKFARRDEDDQERMAQTIAAARCVLDRISLLKAGHTAVTCLRL